MPANGALILAPNHFSNLDHFFCGVFLRRRIRFMSKSQFFGLNPLVSYLFRVSGHFPVRRGNADTEAFVTAHSILDRGGCVGIYAEGAARAVAVSASRGRESGGWPWSPGRQWSPSRFTGRSGCASGGGCASPA